MSVNAESAEFAIEGLRSVRVAGDSLDYDGGWITEAGASVAGTTYNVRLRLYRLGNDGVRAAGVHQLRVADVQPIERDVPTEGDATVQFPFTVGAAPGESFAGTTFGYAGEAEEGAALSGLPAGDYPYRRTGDSIRWTGTLRDDATTSVLARYNLRLLSYDATGARVGGVVTLALNAR